MFCVVLYCFFFPMYNKYYQIVNDDMNTLQDFNETSATCESDISNSLNESTSLVEDQQVKSSWKKKSTFNRASIKTPKSSSSKQTDSDNESGLERSLLLPSVPSSTTPKIVIKGASSNSAKSSGSKYKPSNVKRDLVLCRYKFLKMLVTFTFLKSV